MSVQEDVDSLLSVIGPFLDTYSLADVGFVAIKTPEKTRLLSARVVLHVPYPGMPRVQLKVESEHVLATRDLVTVSRPEIDSLITAFAAGALELPGIRQQLEKRDEVGLYTSASLFNQSVPAGTARVPSLAIRGATKHELLTSAGGNDRLDWELRAASPPFESLNELAMNCGLPALLQMGDMCLLEVVAMAPAGIAADSAINAGKATINIVAAKGVDLDRLRLGYRALRGGRMERGAIESSAINWSDEGDLRKGTHEITVDDTLTLQVFLSYRSVALHQWWITDRTRVTNPRLSAHYAVDPDLRILRDLLLSPEHGDRFESAVGLLAFVCGFSPAHYGVAPRLRDFADLTIATPSNRMAVVECTIGLPGIKDKLAKLKQRTIRVRQHMERAGLQHLEVLPIIVTACGRDELGVDAPIAAEHGIAIFARENIENLLARVSYLPNPEALFDEAKTLIPQRSS